MQPAGQYTFRIDSATSKVITFRLCLNLFDVGKLKKVPESETRRGPDRSSGMEGSANETAEAAEDGYDTEPQSPATHA